MSNIRVPQNPGIDFACDILTPQEVLTVQQLTALGTGASDAIIYREPDGDFKFVTLGAGLSFAAGTLSVTSSGVTWGGITGTLSNQTDLYNALELKAHQNVGICVETPITANDISFNATSRVLTIIPPLGEFHYFTDGSGIITKHTVTGNVNFPAITDTTGVWYFYFNNSGTAIASQTPWTDFSLIAPIARITWNSTKTPDTAKVISYFLETHPNDISAIDHLWKHRYGAIWISGGDIAANTTTGVPNTSGLNTCIGISTVTAMDDNLLYTVTNDSTPTNNWEQDLGQLVPANLTTSNGAIFNVRYKGSGGAPELVQGTRFPFLFNGSTNIPQYVNTSGARTNVTNNYHFVYFVYTIIDPRVGNTVRITPYYGEAQTIADAKAITWESVQAQDPGANDSAIRPLYRLIFQYKTAYDVSVKYAALVEYLDIRKALVAQAPSAAGTINASAVVFTPIGNISSTNVQSALNELDNEKAAISGQVFTGNVYAPGVNGSFRTQATNGASITLTSTDAQVQEFTGTSSQTVLLPSTGVLAGQSFNISNQSTNTVTIQSSGANTITTLSTLTSGFVTAKVNTPTTAAHWDFSNDIKNSTSGYIFEASGATASSKWVATTGSGSVVRGTSPSITTSIVGGATFSVFNTATTNLSAFGAATTLTVGGTPTTAITHSYSANATASGATKTVNIATGAVAGSTTTINIGAQASATSVTVNGKILVAKGVTTDFDAQKTTGSINSYLQENIQNTSNGGSASSDNVCTADTGNETTNFIDMGINSSGYNDAAFNIGAALDGFLYTNGGNLTIGTATAAKVIKFHTGGTTSTQLRATIGDSSFTIETPGNATKCILTTDATQTLTNKRITRRVGTTTSSATPTINTDTVDYYSLTAQAADITSFTTNLSGTPTDGQKLWISITGTAARAITWGASFEASTVALPTTTVTTARLDVGFIWNAATSKWRCVGTA